MTIEGRHILVTGAAQGIGRGLVQALGACGARVAAVDCDSQTLTELAETKPAESFVTIPADVTDLAGMQAAVPRAEEELGPLDLLIANAGVFRETSATDFDATTFADEIQINLIGAANSMASVLLSRTSRSCSMQMTAS